MEHVTIKFHGENAEDIKEALFDWIDGGGSVWGGWSYIRDRGIETQLINVEVDGNVIHVRER